MDASSSESVGYTITAKAIMTALLVKLVPEYIKQEHWIASVANTRWTNVCRIVIQGLGRNLKECTAMLDV